MRGQRVAQSDEPVFLTQVVAGRARLFADAALVELLRAVLHSVKAAHPFEMLAYVFLPDHLHLLIRPQAPATASVIMAATKAQLSRGLRLLRGIPGPVIVWQKGFWDHSIRDQADFNRHVDYIHYNPVKHGWCTRPEAWPHSSFAVWSERGFYPEMWGWSLPDWLHAVRVRDVE